MAMGLDDVKFQVAVANRVLAELGLATGLTASLGHASLRVPGQPDTFVVKGRGYEVDSLDVMRPQDMVVCDLEGNFVDGPPGSSQCREVKMHSCVYKLRPDVQSIVHAHPHYTILLSVAQNVIRPMRQEGVQLVRKPLPVYPHVKTVQSDAEGMDVARLLGDARAILLQGHGATTTGQNLDQSVTAMLHLEEQAQINWEARCAFGPDYPYISDALIDEMTERTPIRELAHFQHIASSGQDVAGGNLYSYYAWKVSRDL
jgi:ribulose-5-phosphate 4-epimerase/fuculose-1-phosphate aldolase